jgi:TetR/AcrR family transcriptional regulator, transcriptional repressor for nem operon
VNNGTTVDRILDVAERLVQTHGYNAFSYADIAGELGITKASLHYHFATKAALGSRLIQRYTEKFCAALEEIAHKHAAPRRKLQAYVQLYEEVLRQNRMCLCGMLAADSATLPSEMRDQLREFFDANESWLAAVLDSGRKLKQLRFSGSAQESARMLLGSLEGAMLVSRSYADVPRFSSMASLLLSTLTVRRGSP